MHGLTRRGLLGAGLAGAGLATFGGLAPFLGTARAAGDEDLYFVFAYFNGGWDLLLSLDPRDPRIFRSDLRKVTRIQPGYELLPNGYDDLVHTSIDGMTFGPYIGGLADIAEDITVVRGMSMDTLTHEVGRRRFLTGRPPAGLQAKGSSLATVLASQLGASQPIPQLSVLVESYNDGLPAYASAIRVNSVDDLLRALRPAADGVTSAEIAAIDDLLANARACDRAAFSRFLSESFEFRDGATDLVSLGLDDRFDFAANTTAMQALRDHYGIDPTDMTSAPAQAAAAVTALTTGISRCVSFEAARDLDAHGPDWAASHGPRQRDGFDVVAALIADLKSREYGDSGDTWFDHTVVMAFSEFGRAPLLNSSSGRDHFLHNACMVAGGGIRGGRVLGASSDVGMAPRRIDYATGVVDAGGDIVRPEAVFRALMVHAGIEEDIADLDAEPFMALLA